MSGKNTNGDIVVSYIHANSHGALVQQYTTVHRCKRRLFSKKCWDDHYPRALTSEEILVIQDGLLSHGYSYLLT